MFDGRDTIVMFDKLAYEDLLPVRWRTHSDTVSEVMAAQNLVERGIRVNRVVSTAFAIGAGLAAVAGLLYAVQAGQINPYMGFTPVLKAFIAAVIGGFGSIAGAVLGGYVLGFLEVLVTALAGQ